MLAGHIIINHAAFHRSGAVKGYQGDHIIKSFRLEPNQQIFHARTFKLKHTGGIPGGQQPIGHCIGQLDVIKIRRCLAVIGDQTQGVGNHGQVAQTQKIKFYQPDFLDDFHIVLGHHFTFFPPVKRHIINQRLVGDNHTGGMGRCVSGKTFKHATDLDQLIDFGLLMCQFDQPGLPRQGFFQSDVQYIGNHFGNRVHLSQGNIQRTSNIANHSSGFQLPEGNDLGDVISAAVFIDDVSIDLFPAVDAKININIRHAFAGRI